MNKQFKRNQDTIRKLVLDTLLEEPVTRTSSTELILSVLKKMNINTDKSFVELARTGELRSLETITRHRRQLLKEYPDLLSEQLHKLQEQKEENYHEYFAQYKENVL